MNVARAPVYIFSSGDPAEGAPGAKSPPSDDAARLADLPFRVELWNERKLEVERFLAFAASGSIGYAAYYAATAEFPDRYIVLRHGMDVLSRWNGPIH
jgi:hypothetical protein